MGKKNQPTNQPMALSSEADRRKKTLSSEAVKRKKTLSTEAIKRKTREQKRATPNQRMAFGKAKIKRKNLFTTADVMKLFDISESSAKRWRRKRVLPYVKMGGTIYYFKDVIFKMLQDRTIFPDSPDNKP